MPLVILSGLPGPPGWDNIPHSAATWAVMASLVLELTAAGLLVAEGAVGVTDGEPDALSHAAERPATTASATAQ